MNKINLFLVGIVLMFGFVVAAPSNLSSLVLEDFVAGGIGVARFSFDYLMGDNFPEGSLVLRVNVSSLESEEDCSLDDCAVWEGDFGISGFVEQFPLFGFLGLEKTTPLRCLERGDVEFFNGNGLVYSFENDVNGTFYCFDPSNYLDVLDLERRDDVALEVSSNAALYPGEYGVSVELMEMERDWSPPVMELILEGAMFSEGDVIPIRLDVRDMYNVRSVEYEIMNPSLDGFYSSGWIAVEYNVSSGFYEDDFDMGVNGLSVSGSYWIKARSCDVLGNCGEL